MWKVVTNNPWTSVAGAVGALMPVANDLLPLVPPHYAGLASFIVMGLGLVAAKDGTKK